ncbi:MAG: FAD-dependent oxidoreductase [Gammaproteobacteria bacterium]|nr:FAD-dependent oxidoreductase [Gammaproteobacteria bacterium]NNJ50291.1 FAD-dependent oxidoreductase [Gammaproteobacteria bacterium]
MNLKDLLSPFFVWQRAFEKPYTSIRPTIDRPGAPAYRGFHINIADTCVGCGSCHEICQNHAIDMVAVEEYLGREGDSGLRPRFDYGRCCWCGLCVDICTAASLRMSNEYAWISEDPTVFHFTAGVDDKPWQDNENGYRRAEGYHLYPPKRIEMEMLPANESVSSFEEVVKGYSEEQAKKEADRCVECGICVATCPAHMDVPDYIHSIRDGNYEKGLQLMYRTNPFPATCGRICTRRCESVCPVGILGEPVAIRWLKRLIVDQVDASDYQRILADTITENGKKIAVIGAGPGGMSAAYYLRKKGYAVTVFEAQESAGGMLRYGVPSYRLPDNDLDKDIDYIVSLGVEIKYNTAIGKDIKFEQLLENYDAVFMSTGLSVPSSMRIHGEDHPRVLSGLQVLADVANGRDPGIGKKVAVIGGGNVAMDAARVSRRFDAEVTILYRRRISEMPADEEEIHESQEEGCRIVQQAIPVEIVSADSEQQVAIRWGEAEMVDDPKGGRPRPVLQEDRMHTDTYDSIISAIGQGSNLDYISKEMHEEFAIEWGKFTPGEYQHTTLEKVFVGGDFANSTADAISAIEDGHHAARGIDRYLNPAAYEEK